MSCVGGSESRGTSVTSAGTRTFVGLEELEVAGDAVPTYHYRDERTLTGDQSGTEQAEIWYSAHDGLPVRIERTVDVDTPSPFGDITYTETGTLTLTSLEPRR